MDALMDAVLVGALVVSAPIFLSQAAWVVITILRGAR